MSSPFSFSFCERLSLLIVFPKIPVKNSTWFLLMDIYYNEITFYSLILFYSIYYEFFYTHLKTDRIITHWISPWLSYRTRWWKYVKLKKVNCNNNWYWNFEKMRNNLDLDIFLSPHVFSTIKKKKQNIYIIIYHFMHLSGNSINASSFMHTDYYPATIFTWKITNTLLCIRLDNNLEQRNGCFYVKINVES